jgi:hypothetical protein
MYSKDELPVRPPFFCEKYEHGGQLNAKFIFRFMEITHEPFHLLSDNEVWCTKFIISSKLFKYGDSAKFLGYAGPNTEPLCNTVQCNNISVNYLTC